MMWAPIEQSDVYAYNGLVVIAGDEYRHRVTPNEARLLGLKLVREADKAEESE